MTEITNGQIKAWKENDELKMSCFLARESEIKGLKDISHANGISKATLIRIAIEHTFGVTCSNSEHIGALATLDRMQIKKLNKLLHKKVIT